MKKIFCFIIVLVSVPFLFSCSRWRVSDLKPERLLTVPSGAGQDKINLQFKNGNLLDLNFSVRVSSKRLYCADNSSGSLFVYNRSGKRELTIGHKPISGDMTNYAVFDFSSIGAIADDSDGNIYVQNRLQKTPDDASDMVPSYVLVFNSDGKLEMTLGQDGVAGTPFSYVENIFTDDSNRLFVVARSFESWGVYRFKGKNRDASFTFDKDSFMKEAAAQSYHTVIEDVVPYRSGDSVLVSVSFYSATRFKFRRIYEINASNSKNMREILELPDPRNELFTVMDDKYLLLWEVEKNDVRFVIWSFQESIVNNLRLSMDGRKSYLEQVICDEKGKIYTYSVRRDGIDIFQWE